MMKSSGAKIIVLFLIVKMSFFASDEIKAQCAEAPAYVINAPFKMDQIIVPEFQKKDFSIKDYGGVNDGQTLNTNAFAKAIAACVAAGGGRVVVPKGTWLTGPIQMQSNVNLCVEHGALIQFTKDHSKYPMIPASSKSSKIVPASPIYGYDLKNIAITGDGIIDGAGETWRPVKRMKTTASQWQELVTSGGVVSSDGQIWWPSTEAMEGEKYLKELKQKNPQPTPDDYLPARDFLRPYMVYFINCSNILIENVTLRNSPKFVFYPNSCSNLTMRYVNVFNEWWAQNGDGIDISQCKNVLIYRCTVSAGDDGICMKSGGGTNKSDQVNLENVIIDGCTVYRAHGGFVIGSNTDGGMQNIFVNNCHFMGSDIGVRVKSNRGRGGLVKNIFIRNIFMTDIRDEAISFDTYYEDVPAGNRKRNTVSTVDDKIPEFTDFYFDSIYCDGAKAAIFINGLPEKPIRGIYFKNMILSAGNGFHAANASDIFLDNVIIIPEKDPVFLLNNVKNINIKKGYFPPTAAIFYKADAKTTGVNITETDLRK